MTIIMFVAISIFIISVVWIWHNLGSIEKNKKVMFIVIGFIITYFITLIIYNFSNSNIIYPNEEIEKAVSNMLLIIFTELNSLILLPFMANLFGKVMEEEIEGRQVRNRLVIILIIFIACISLEKGYLRNTQEGIINIYNEVKNAET